MSKAERDIEAVADALGALLRGDAASGAAKSDASRARLLRRAAEPAIERRRPSAWWGAVALPGLAAALCVWWWTPGALRYDVVGTTKDGDYVSAPVDRAVRVHFSDDTLVEIAANSQLRVEGTTRHGARVFLERGSADAHVVHRDGTQWTFAAGPFEVLVTGTHFDLGWDPATGVLDVHLREGSVQVQTPFGAAPVQLRAGQDFRADLRARNMTTTDHVEAARDRDGESTAAPAASAVAAAAPDASPPGVEEPVVPAGSGSPSASNLPARGAASPPPSALRAWSKLIALGRFADVLAQAQTDKGGTANCVRTCSASDLAALADAARYTGRADLAEQSLRALRTRFTADSEGRSAAFLLGRLREQQGNSLEARGWYQRYMGETPGGPYAAEALAGTMRTTAALDGRSAAAPIAEDYLRRYPAGVHAATARAILGAH